MVGHGKDITRSVGRWVCRSVGRWVYRSVGLWVHRSMGPWVHGWMGASVGYSASMKERERLLDMLDRMHDGDAWHGPSVMNIVRTLPAADAEARPLAGAHTIGEI